mgnify:FL=1
MNRIVAEITSKLDIDAILLFGSYAKGEENDSSDIDIAVISSEFDAKKSMYLNAMKVYEKTDFIEPYLQLVPLASDSFYNESFIDKGFVKSIRETGRSLYTKK